MNNCPFDGTYDSGAMGRSRWGCVTFALAKNDILGMWLDDVGMIAKVGGTVTCVRCEPSGEDADATEAESFCDLIDFQAIIEKHGGCFLQAPSGCVFVWCAAEQGTESASEMARGEMARVGEFFLCWRKGRGTLDEFE